MKEGEQKMENNLQQIQAEINQRKKQLEILKNQKSWKNYIAGAFWLGIGGTIVLYVVEMAIFPFMSLLGQRSGFIFGVIQGIAIAVGRCRFKTRKARKVLKETDAATLNQEISQLQQLERQLSPTYTNSRHVQQPIRPQPSNQPRQTTNTQQNNASPTQPQYSFHFNPNRSRNRNQQTSQPPKTKQKTR